MGIIKYLVTVEYSKIRIESVKIKSIINSCMEEVK